MQPIPLRPSRRSEARQAEGLTPQEIALQAIVILARKPQTAETRAALRALIQRFNFYFSLDY